MPRLAFAAALAAALAAVATASPAFAAERDAPTRTLTVYAADLRTEAGADEAYAQLKRLSRRVCDQPTVGLRATFARRACVRAALDAAVAQSARPEIRVRHLSAPTAR